MFESVYRNRCDYGVVPIENTTEGAVTHTLDMFIDYDLQICSEISLAIHHHLMVKDNDVDIKTIYSHAQVFAQCRSWLQKHYPDVALISTDSTTAAAEMAKISADSAAIASDEVSRLCDLDIIASDIQDNATNITRFLVIGHQLTEPTGCDKTSLLFSLKNEPGILVDALQPFKEKGLNLKKIESRPSMRDAWGYYFYVDFDGHRDEDLVSDCLDLLKKKAVYFKILGSYPQEV